VNTKYTSKEGVVSEAEEGLMGIIVHPLFAKNHWIYMYYADPADTKHVLARWELHGDSLYPSTKKVLLEIPTQREVCCHTGGGMAFDVQGNLYMTVGNNTANPASALHRMMKDPGEAVGTINAAQEAQMTCAERSCAYILKMMAPIQFPRVIYLRKERRKPGLRST
jgi:glucose/arabinose dehydrogenase